jgi:hypothetical protein
MKAQHREMEFAIEVFVRGHSAGRSRTFPYEATRVGPLWVMRDEPRKNPRDYRKEEWIAYNVDAPEVDAIARRHTRGRFFVCAMVGQEEPDEPTRTAYKVAGLPASRYGRLLCAAAQMHSKTAFFRIDRAGAHTRVSRTAGQADAHPPDLN